ncbi:ExeM/NucH family extracellular endonuclease [Ideonella sp. BN130291]|uniref:ExeM/NucH family extracellular endonuclease n=1 Tax=Ideonella sp. BN130291 TaxID=3112940 RepID=UPI002E26BC75|nr:ExeM/NucH family extracellular endonuclease [Ideonella sp. BN130291]
MSACVFAACAAMAADTPIHAIQGSGATSPLVSQVVTTTGVVTKVINNGFYLQDPAGDGNPLTSDGIFVFTGSVPTVQAGQQLRLSGKVTEFNTGAAGNAHTAARPVTELTSVSGLTVLGSGFGIAPVVVSLPEAMDGDLERYEGMLVTLAGPLTVSQNYFLGRFGQVTLSAGGRMETPTNRHRPGPDAQALANENARRRILLDDGSSAQNPNPMPYLGVDNTLRAGDTVASVTGVIDFGLATASNAEPGDYKIHPTVVPVFVRSNPRTATPEAVGGNLKVASFNVLNFFTTFTNGETADGRTGQGCTLDTSTSASNCRGANNRAEFERQRAKIVSALAAINADAVGLMEMQNNGSTAVQNLVDALNAQLGAGTYAAVPDPASGTGTDAIKVAMIYKPARLARVGASTSDTTSVHNRPPLAQTFELANHERFTLVVNHFKSKGCDGASGPDADQGDLQGCWNNRRLQQAAATRSFVARLQAASNSNDVLLVGDFNAYAKEDPIVDFTGAGYVDLVGRDNTFGYSYVFDGAAGRLDQALATASLAAKAVRAADWHINADEPAVLDYNLEFKQPACATCAPDNYMPTPYRSSDHDPVVVGLSLFRTIEGTANRDSLTGTAGDDILIGGPGADLLAGRGGINVYRYLSMRDAGDTVGDFVPGKDQVDLRALLASIGYTGADAFADARVRLVDGSAGVSVQIDSDGPGAGVARPLLTLQGVSAASLQPARDFILR